MEGDILMKKNQGALLMLFLVVLIEIMIFLFVPGCFPKKPISKNDYAMGVYIQITAYGRKASEAIDEAFERIKEIENKMSINKDISEVIEINRKAGKEWVKVSPDTYYVIKEGLKFSGLTNGNFDITIGPVVKLWNIGFENALVPSKEELYLKKPLVGFDMVALDENDNKVRLNREGMMLDLGGIAKGYSADEAIRVLRKYGVESAIVNIGGNISVLNTKPGKIPWRIGIQDPDKKRGDNLAVLSVVDESIVTSGYYERFIEKEGELYHHILNPFTGMPAETGISSVTVISKKSITADALSTGIFVLGLGQGLKHILDKEDIEVVIVNNKNQIFITPSLLDRIELRNKDYKIIIMEL